MQNDLPGSPGSEPSPGRREDSEAGPAPSTGAQGTPQVQGSAQAVPKKKLPGGAKLLFGCLGVGLAAVLLGAIALVVLFNVGGSLLSDRVEQFAGGVERQAEAERALRQLQRDHPFQQPAEGVVDDAGARMVFSVTDDMWEVMEPWAEELADLARRMDERDAASITDLAAGVRGLSRFVEGRAIFAETLAAHGVSAEEYLWTGLALIRAHEELERPEASRVVPQENLALARRYDRELSMLRRTGDDDRPEKGAVFHMGVVWGMTDGSAWRAMGLDTMHFRNH